MSTVFLSSGGSSYERTWWAAVAPLMVLSMHFDPNAAVAAQIASAAPGVDSISGTMDEVQAKLNIGNSFSVSGVRFSAAGQSYIVKANGDVQVNPNPFSGLGTSVGALTAADGTLKLDQWTTGGTPVVSNLRGVATPPNSGDGTPYNSYGCTFRTATAPLRPQNMSILGTMMDGTTFNVTPDEHGFINATRVKGIVNYETGVVIMIGVNPTGPAGQDPADISFLGITGVTTAYIDLIQIDSIRYSAVAYSYLPLDATLLGIDPVRLPTDGRVPMFRPGDLVVAGYKVLHDAQTVTNGQTVDLGTTRLSRVRVLDSTGVVIEAGYSSDLEAGTVTFSDVSSYSQPIRIEHRVEDYIQLQDVQIDGSMQLMRPLSHVFPKDVSYISSAYRAGDLQARVSAFFDQATWDGITFLDTVSGNVATGTYDSTNHPVEVTNAGAVTERFGLKFTSATAFQIIGEHLGVIGTGNTTTDCAPVNPNSSQPYFILRKEGWGAGWAAGNALRINLVGALPTIWLARTVKQSSPTSDDYAFTLLTRGDIDNPAP